MSRRAFRALRTAVTWSVIFLMTVDSAIAGNFLTGGLCGHLRGRMATPSGFSCASGGYSSCAPNYSYVTTSCGTAYGGCAPVCSAPVYSMPVCSTPTYSASSMCCSSDTAYATRGAYDNDCGSCGACGNCCGVTDSGCVSDGYVGSGYVEGGYDAGSYMDSGYVSEGYVDGGYSGGVVVESGCVGCDLGSADDGTGGYVESYSEGAIVEEGTVIEGTDVLSDGTMVEDAVIESVAPVIEIPAQAPAVESLSTPEPSSTDELFGTEPATDIAPVPPEDDALEDMFDEPAAEALEEPPAPPADDALEDMFDEPATEALEEPTAAPAEDDPLEDMFDEPATDATEEPPAAPAEEAPAEEGDELDDLFGSLPTRDWRDDTGNYQTVGRLAEIREDSIRIFKTNGRHCTVPFHRLSDNDFEYVQVIAAGLKESTIQLASAN